jgi:hypothetical protein
MYLVAERLIKLVSFRGRVHLIPGHPSINGRANDLFRQYQKQAATGEIQFRRWPLRTVSLSLLIITMLVFLIVHSTNV